MSLTRSHPAPLEPSPPLLTLQKTILAPKMLSSVHQPKAQFGSGGQSLEWGGIRPPQNTPADAPPINPAGKIAGARRPIAALKGRGLAYPVTPGNTPSSLEKITRRIASNLMGETPEKPGAPHSKIAPSYELRLDAELKDLDRHLTTKMSKSPPPSPPSGHARAWPQSFGAASTNRPHSNVSMKTPKE